VQTVLTQVSDTGLDYERNFGRHVAFLLILQRLFQRLTKYRYKTVTTGTYSSNRKPMYIYFEQLQCHKTQLQ